MQTLSNTEGFLGLVLGFGFIIFVHELGHFLVAKAVGIKVTQFALGFGHSILTWRKGLGLRIGSTEKEYEQRLRQHLRGGRPLADGETEPEYSQADLQRAQDELQLGETEYRLNWMPIGGYVKMLGQDDMDPNAISGDPRSFSAKPVWARACVISAGVIMNLIFALIFFMVAFSYGVEFPRNIVGAVNPEGPAATAYPRGYENRPAYRGLQVGDRILEIDGEPVVDFMDVTLHTALAKKGHSLLITVDRPGEKEPLTFEILPEVSRGSGLLSAGIDAPYTTVLARLPKESELFEAGVRPDMRIVAIDGDPVLTFHDYHQHIVGAKGLPTEVTFADESGATKVSIELAAVPMLTREGSQPGNLLGLVPSTQVLYVAEDGPAAKAGLLLGDVVTKAGSTAWPTPEELIREVELAADESRGVDIEVNRGGEYVAFTGVIPNRKKKIGVVPGYAFGSTIVGMTVPGSTAASLQLNRGSRITSVNGAPVMNWADLQRLLQMAVATAGSDASVTLGFELNIINDPKGETKIALSAKDVQAISEARWENPIPDDFFLTDYMLVKADNTGQAVALGFEKTHQFMMQTYVTLARLFQGTVKPYHLKGPVGIVVIGTKVATRGWMYLLFFLGLISVNLVVINFLPMPIVDGGLMVFLIIEKIKGSPVSPRILSAANLVGLVLLAGIFLMVTYFDLRELI